MRTAEMFDPCVDDCNCVPAAGIDRVCRYNYIGGYLAECTNTCDTDLQCESGLCSGGFCVRALCNNIDTACESGTFCYPPLNSGGEQLYDNNHPEPHCMTEAM